MTTGITLLLIIVLAIAFIIVASARWGVHPFISLLLAALGVGLLAGLPAQEVITAVNNGFGSLMGYIGLIVVLGSIIGVILEKSGAALRIATLVLRWSGRRNPALSMSVIGAITSIPVFCDSGFIILSGLNKAVARQTKVNQGALALALASGLYTTHTLVPPTPGPIAAAGNIGAADYLGTIMLIGFVISVPTLLVAVLSARRLGRRIEIEEEDIQTEATEQMPNTWLSVLPILLPIVLIGLASVLKLVDYSGIGSTVFFFVGHPLIALLIGLGCALFLLPAWHKTYLTDWVGEGIKMAGPILIITGAGGAFGSVLKATPLTDMVKEWFGQGEFAGAWFLIIAFAIAAFLKSSQGSSTNALVITSSLLAPLVPQLGFTTPVEMALVVMAIGGGAMTVSHANDSYFWVVSQFSGISMKSAYRSFTLITGLQGLTVLVMTLLLFAVYQLVG